MHALQPFINVFIQHTTYVALNTGLESGTSIFFQITAVAVFLL